MSISDLSQKVRLVADADEGTEIFVIDGRFRRVASSLKRLETELPPGLYTVKFKRGSAVAEVDADLLPGSAPVRVQIPHDALAFASAAPMEQTTTSHEYHQRKAAEISRRLPEGVSRGEESQLFVFVRDICVDGMGNPAKGLSLHNLRGKKVVDFEKIGESGHAQDTSCAAWYGCNIALAPGFYRLRARRSWMPDLEQALILAPGWQVQVFAVRNARSFEPSCEITTEAHRSLEYIDLSRGTIFMRRPGLGFDPDDPSVRLTELARQGLTSGRVPVTEDDIREMLRGKFENPMLGLFCAHLLIPLLAGSPKGLSQRPDDSEMLQRNRTIQRFLGVTADGSVGPQTRERLRKLINQVVSSLEILLGDHPDMNALRVELSEDASIVIDEKSAFPPMLRRSWDTLVRLNPRYYRAKAESLLSRMADRIWGTGPWMVWQVPPVAAVNIILDPKKFRQIASYFNEKVPDTAELARSIWKSGLSSVEESIVRHTIFKAQTPPQRAAFSSGTFQDESQIKNAKQEAAQILGMPFKTLERNLESAMTKLDAAAQQKKIDLPGDEFK